MRTPIYVSFFTRNTLYEKEVQRLAKSVERFGLEHDVRGIESRGDWTANTRYTCRFLRDMMDAHPGRPVVYLDADAYVWQYPGLFEALDCDIAFYRMPDHGRLANGTLYLAPTEPARKCIGMYAKLVSEGFYPVDEQRCLDKAINDLWLAGVPLRVGKLPASYCYIHDLNADDLRGASVVIEHLQASREQATGTPALGTRRARIKVAEAAT